MCTTNRTTENTLLYKITTTNAATQTGMIRCVTNSGHCSTDASMLVHTHTHTHSDTHTIQHSHSKHTHSRRLLSHCIKVTFLLQTHPKHKLACIHACVTHAHTTPPFIPLTSNFSIDFPDSIILSAIVCIHNFTSAL